jgi:hypothetical protein
MELKARKVITGVKQMLDFIRAAWSFTRWRRRFASPFSWCLWAAMAVHVVGSVGIAGTIDTLVPEQVVIGGAVQALSFWDYAVMTVLDGAPLLDTESKLHFVETFSISPVTNGLYNGSFAGVLSGQYLSEPWTVNFSSTFTGVLDPADPDFDVDVSGKWAGYDALGDKKDKPFTGKGKLTEDDKKLKGKVTIKTGDTEDSIDVNLDVKKENDKEIKAEGSVDVGPAGKKTTETLNLQLDPKKKTAKVKLRSPSGWGVDVDILTGNGTYTTAMLPSGGVEGVVSFDVGVGRTPTTVPEPATFFISGIGLLVISRILKVIKPVKPAK